MARTVVQIEARRLRAKKREVKREVSLQQPIQTSGGSSGEPVELIRQSATSPSQALRRDERFERG